MRLFFLVLLLPHLLNAAPIPTTGSSVIHSPKWNTAFSQMGFKFNLVSDDWIFIDNPTSSKQAFTQQVDLALKSLSPTARLSLKTEPLKTDLESHVKKFLRDYNQYGFEVLSTKTMKINNASAVIIDLLQKNKLTQSRQVFFGAKDKITIASCVDKVDQFALTSNVCNQLLNQFHWR